MNSIAEISPKYHCNVCQCDYLLGRYADIKDNKCPCCDNKEDLVLMDVEIWRK